MLKILIYIPFIALLTLVSCTKNTAPGSSTSISQTSKESTTQLPATTPKKQQIEWLSMEEAAKRMQKEPRKVVIDVYTDWCGWCKKMDKSTFTDPEVAQLVNKHFYAVKLDAEGKQPITLNGKTFTYKSEYKSHELAVALLQGQMSFPTTVYLDEKMNMLAPVPGYLDAKNFSRILRYFGENHHKQMNFHAYEKQAKGN